MGIEYWAYLLQWESLSAEGIEVVFFDLHR